MIIGYLDPEGLIDRRALFLFRWFRVPLKGSIQGFRV